MIADVVRVMSIADVGSIAKFRALALRSVLVDGSRTDGDLPNPPPELWADRNRTLAENPAEFVFRVYAPYLDGVSFSRADLKALDKRCYQALSNWLRTNAVPEWLQLPTKAERNEAIMNDLSERDRIVIRAYEATRQRSRKK